MGIQIEQRGRRYYLIGDTYSVRDRIRSGGGKWDPEAKAWWTGKRDVAEQLVGQLAAEPNGSSQSPSQGNDRPAPGPDQIVAARATYKGTTYYVAGRVVRGHTRWDDTVSAISTRDGAKLLLCFRDGSKSFWASRDEVQVARAYQRPTTIKSLREYAERRKAEDRGEVECALCERYCTCGVSFCHHHHDGCDRCGAER